MFNWSLQWNKIIFFTVFCLVFAAVCGSHRAHGDTIVGRAVVFIELFCDLIYVVLIAQAAHTLADDVTWAAFGKFAVIFGLIWLAWANGTIYQDLHGSEDIRSRTFIFLQMLIL
ncbi:MAG: low temperature requirement protein A [Anaerolineaceae bacterium]|nr:low temperature requirement protein A [Anaerolineaceae bacterium]